MFPSNFVQLYNQLREEYCHGLLLANLSWWTSSDVIQKAYEKASIEVTGIYILEDESNGRSIGFCCVGFDNEQSLTTALRCVLSLEGQTDQATTYEFNLENFKALLVDALEHSRIRDTDELISCAAYPSVNRPFFISDPGLLPWYHPSVHFSVYEENTSSDVQYGTCFNLPDADAVMRGNKFITSAAIKQAVDFSLDGNIKEARQVLLAAVITIQQSKISLDERCLMLVVSLEDMLTALDNQVHRISRRRRRDTREDYDNKLSKHVKRHRTTDK